MAEQTVEPTQQTFLRRRIDLLRKQASNPVTIKELRSRMRGRRAFVVLTSYLAIMSGLIVLIYLAFINSGATRGSDVQVAGKVLFSAVVGIQGFLVLFVAPAFTSGAISGEKERQTYDLLRTTLLSAPSFVLGKLVSSLSYVILLILTAVPLQSFAFLLGGVTFTELILSQLILIVAAVTVAMFGLYASSRMRTSLGASVLTFAGILLVTFGFPALISLFAIIASPVLFASSSTNTESLEIVGIYLGHILAGFNLPATLIWSDIILVDEGALFFYSDTIYSRTLFFPSPWPLFILFYGIIAWILYRLTVRRVRKIAEE
ncbi:MAG: hypothetical protein AAF490_22370 [Chloroflexota bacterium]